MNRRRRMSAAITLALLATGVTVPGAMARTNQSHCPLPVFGPGRQYHPVIHPDEFSATVDMPLFPLRPGVTMVYAGSKDGRHAVDVVTPSSRTLVIDGVRTRVVEDRLYLDGRLEERTSDYYAQDRCGNVWYFGEDTAELDAHGQVTSTEGSFHAGVDGAQPGVYLTADPHLGRWFRQEWYAGQAEDQVRTIKQSVPVDVPYGHFQHALRTEERTDLEPGTLDAKWYVPGIGEVEELAVRGPVERLVLVDVLS